MRLSSRLIILYLSTTDSTVAAFSIIRRHKPKKPALFLLKSTLSDDDDFALVGLNALQPTETLELSSSTVSTTPSQSAFGVARNNDKGAPSPNSVSTPGLTEDGDFILEGVNAVDPSANQGLEKYGTPLLNSNNNQGRSEGGLLSQLSLATTNTPPSNEEAVDPIAAASNILTSLTDDGDLALPGFNAIPPTQERQDDNPLNSYSQQPLQPPLISSSPPAPVPSRRENSLQEVEDMTFWLQDMIPTLRDDDCIHYADALVSLGFDPECVTAGALVMDDLHFMKPLHRRYLVKEVANRSNNHV
ncbi:expressed unknown protein [Seminavis robusta]|uniref:Uncharacterized protein n=1 Tax=Seminavis robusta TaxID=568900 RepID=A0A9N8HA65_9STRA|nr:expressed unknown protein [Seminavis robusta]|eukprot:Sro307_g113290.1 n/a (302) ;mRNA; r:36067-36972